jgi:hypothetical protein
VRRVIRLIRRQSGPPGEFYFLFAVIFAVLGFISVPSMPRWAVIGFFTVALVYVGVGCLKIVGRK